MDAQISTTIRLAIPLLMQCPFSNGSVIADQVYEYTIGERCSAARRSIRFYLREQNAAGNPNRFHFEVEYPIGPS
jgi:hypothetical protein